MLREDDKFGSRKFRLKLPLYHHFLGWSERDVGLPVMLIWVVRNGARILEIYLMKILQINDLITLLTYIISMEQREMIVLWNSSVWIWGKLPEESNNPYYLLPPPECFTLEIREIPGYLPPVKLQTLFKRKVLGTAELNGISMVAGRNSCLRTNMVLMLWFLKTQTLGISWIFLEILKFSNGVYSRIYYTQVDI